MLDFSKPSSFKYSKRHLVRTSEAQAKYSLATSFYEPHLIHIASCSSVSLSLDLLWPLNNLLSGGDTSTHPLVYSIPSKKNRPPSITSTILLRQNKRQ